MRARTSLSERRCPGGDQPALRSTVCKSCEGWKIANESTYLIKRTGTYPPHSGTQPPHPCSAHYTRCRRMVAIAGRVVHPRRRPRAWTPNRQGRRFPAAFGWPMAHGDTHYGTRGRPGPATRGQTGVFPGRLRVVCLCVHESGLAAAHAVGERLQILGATVGQQALHQLALAAVAAVPPWRTLHAH